MAPRAVPRICGKGFCCGVDRDGSYQARQRGSTHSLRIIRHWPDQWEDDGISAATQARNGPARGGIVVVAGAGIKIDVDDAPLQAMFVRLLEADANLLPLFTEIGSSLEKSTRDRFVTQSAPDGTPWADLSPVTLARKRTTRKLYERGDLHDSIRFEAGSDFVQIIAGPTEYAATHQFGRDDNKFFGGPDAPIPARPFLGLSADDVDEIDDAVSDFLASVIGD